MGEHARNLFFFFFFVKFIYWGGGILRPSVGVRVVGKGKKKVMWPGNER